jgi:hypothetical protein
MVNARRLSSRPLAAKLPKEENNVTEPLIFISTSRIKEGGLEGYQAYTREMVKLIEEHEPRLLGFATYVSEDGSKATTVQIHPDSDSMMFHMQFIREKMDSAFEFLELESVTFCGQLDEQALGVAKQISGTGVDLSVNSQILGGFTRLASG